MRTEPEQLELDLNLDYSDSRWRKDMEESKEQWDGSKSYSVQISEEKKFFVTVKAKDPSEAQHLAHEWCEYWSIIDKLDTWDKDAEIDDIEWPHVQKCELLDIRVNAQGVRLDG
jgi:hypothetical protein